MKCAVANCGKSNLNKSSECSFFSFPLDVTLQKKWMQFCRRKKYFNPKTSYICMGHFASEDFENSMKYQMGFTMRRKLKLGAVPTIFKVDVKNPERCERIQRRENKRIVSELLKQNKSSNENEFMIDLANQLDDLSHEIADPLCVETEENSSFQDNEIASSPTSCGDLNNDSDFVQFEDLAAKFIADPFCVDTEENSLLDNEIAASPTTCTSLNSDSNVIQQVRYLETKLKAVQRENLRLRIEKKKHRIELRALQRGYEIKMKRHAYNMEVLKMRAMRAENACKDLEYELGDILNEKGNIAPQMSHHKKRKYTTILA